MTYNEFIQDIVAARGQWNIPETEYYEAHHIIPRCNGGLPERYNKSSRQEHENIIWLYPREHFIAHKLLMEENKDNNALRQAYCMMAFVKDSNQQRYELTPEEYEEAKKQNSLAVSIQMTGFSHTDATKQRISESLKGHVVSEEQIEKYKATMLEKRANGYVSPCKGRKATEETRENMSKAQKALYEGGYVNPRKGVKATEEEKEKNRQAHLGLHPSNDARLRMSESCKKYCEEHGPNFTGKDTKWYNNGERSIRATECPEGFVEGRLTLLWFNDGIKNTRAHECPEGFVPGRLTNNKEVA